MQEVFNFGAVSVNNFGMVGARACLSGWMAGLVLAPGVLTILGGALWLATRSGPETLKRTAYLPPVRIAAETTWPGDRAWEKALTNKALLPGKIIWEPKVFRMRADLRYGLEERQPEYQRTR